MRRRIRVFVYAVALLIGMLVDSEIDVSTRKVTPGCVSTVVILTISNPVLINQQDRYQQRPVINIV